jgi:predicted transposase YdaD
MGKKQNKKTVLHPHDNFFKVAFSTKEVTEGYIKEFLPKNIVEKIDFDSLEQDDTNYSTQNLKSFQSDVVWTCKFGEKKTLSKIALLFEHKSYVPQYIHIQLMRYLLEIWQRNMDNQEPLIPVIPIIVYHNQDEKKWYKKSFSEYFQDLDEELKRFIPNFDYHLTDLTIFSAEDILALNVHLLVNTFLSLRFGSNAEWILQNVKILFSGAEDENKQHWINFFVAQFVYLVKNNELSDENINHIVEQLPNTLEMTGYDRIMQRGIEQGVKKKSEDFAISLILSTDFDNEKIALLVGDISPDYVQKLREELKNK